MSKPLSLSGYLPAERETNLPEHAADLIARFDADLADRGESSITLPVIGLLRVEAVKRSRGNDPSVEVRFASLEVPVGTDEETIRTMWRQLRDKRVGEDPLPLDYGTAEDEEEAPADDPEFVEEPGAAPGVATVRSVEFSGKRAGRRS